MGASHPLPKLGAVEQILNEKVVAAVIPQVKRQDLRGSRSRGSLPVHPLQLCTLANARFAEQYGTPASRDGLKRERVVIEKAPPPARRLGKEALVIQDLWIAPGYPKACPAEVWECSGHTQVWYSHSLRDGSIPRVAKGRGPA